VVSIRYMNSLSVLIQSAHLIETYFYCFAFLLSYIQSPMQSCRSLQSLSISANVSKVVQ